jgi:hypothetical protein
VILIPLAVIWQLALRELVLREEGPVISLRQGYRLFRAELGKSLLLFLIQVGVSIGAGIVLVIAGLLVGLVLFIPTIALAAAEQTTAAIIAGVIAGLILLVPVVVASGALGTFTHAFWTLAYVRLRALRGESSAPGGGEAAAA